MKWQSSGTRIQRPSSYSRHRIVSVKPVIHVFLIKWYQQTQKIVLYHLEQEKLKDIHISEFFFSNTPKSRVAQPNITFIKDALLSMLRSLSLFSLFIHLDWLFYAEFESVISFSLRFVAKKCEWYSETHISCPSHSSEFQGTVEFIVCVYNNLFIKPQNEIVQVIYC